MLLGDPRPEGPKVFETTFRRGDPELLAQLRRLPGTA